MADELPQAPQQGIAPNQQAALADMITSAYKSGSDPVDIVTRLMDTPQVASVVHDQLMAGKSADEIMSQFGGTPLATFKANDPVEKIKNQGFLQNAWQGLKKSAGDVGLGAGQMAASLAPSVSAGFEGANSPDSNVDQSKPDPALQQQLMDVQKARDADPANKALMDTAGGEVGNIAGKSVPYIVGGALAPEGVIPAIAAQTAAGGLSGALTPTTAPGDRLKNTAIDAAIGGVTQGALSGLSAGGNALVQALTKTAKADPAAVQSMAQAGLTPTIGTTNPLVKALAGTFSDAKDAMNEAGKKDIVQAALKKVGVDGTDLSSTNLDSAEKAIWSPANKVVAGVQIPPTPELTQSLTAIGQKYGEDALPTFANSKVTGIINDVLQKADAGQLTGPRALDYLRDTKSLAFNADNAADRNAFKAISSTLNDTLTAASPDAGAALKQANALHPSLLTLRDVAARAKDELPTVGQWSTSNTKFANQNAVGPYSDLIAAAKQAYSAPAGSTGRWATPIAAITAKALPAAAALLGEHAGGGVGAMLGYGLGHGGESMLGKALAKVANKPVNAGVRQANVNQDPRLKSALLNALQGAGTATTTDAINNQN